MITLRADRLHWLGDEDVDNPADLCAHSPVTCEIDGEVIARPDDGDWTVSASAIYLLRALDRDHTKESPVGDQIFPCCGHSLYDVGKPEVLISGCSTGIDFEIRCRGESYELTAEDGRVIEVLKEEWRRAVLTYSGEVLDFYDRSAEKEPADKEARGGFSVMMSEWRRLHEKHRLASMGC